MRSILSTSRTFTVISLTRTVRRHAHATPCDHGRMSKLTRRDLALQSLALAAQIIPSDGTPGVREAEPFPPAPPFSARTPRELAGITPAAPNAARSPAGNERDYICAIEEVVERSDSDNGDFASRSSHELLNVVLIAGKNYSAVA